MGRLEFINKEGNILLKNKHLHYTQCQNSVQLLVINNFEYYKNKYDELYKHYKDNLYLMDIYNLLFITDQIESNEYWNKDVSGALRQLSFNNIVFNNKTINIKYKINQKTLRVYSQHKIFNMNSKERRKLIPDDFIFFDIRSFTPSVLSKYIFNYKIGYNFYKQMSEYIKQKDISKVKQIVAREIFSENLINRFTGNSFMEKLYQFKRDIFKLDNHQFRTPKGLKIDITEKNRNLMARVIHPVQTQVIVQIVNKIIENIGIKNFYGMIYDEFIFRKNYFSEVSSNCIFNMF